LSYKDSPKPEARSPKPEANKDRPLPLHEYECAACHHRFEAIQKFSDPPLETCPKCGGTVHKLISAPAFQFKGSGWYVTDYPKKDSGAPKPEGGGKDADSKAAGSKGSEGSGETKADTKSESKSDSKAESKTDSKGESSKPAGGQKS
jgi:putative FmdB family regulatory protein